MLRSQPFAPFALLVATAAIITATPALALQGPSSSQTPYLVPLQNNVNFTSILTTGDNINGYRLAGIPDGLGAYDNNDGTFTVLINHEIANTLGVPRAHGAKGAFVSQWVIDKNTLQVKSGQDLIKTVYNYSSNTPNAYTQLSGAALAFSRFCSADLAAPSAFYNAATGLGTQARIFLNGEENGNGRGLASIATGSAQGSSFVLPWATPNNSTTSWENFLASPNSGDKTVVIGNSDGGQNGVYVYVGNKTTSGNDVEKAGLIGGQVYRVSVNSNASETRNPNAGFNLVNNQASFSLISGNSPGTSFLRPEDGAWDTLNPNVYYFVTTDQIDFSKEPSNTQVSSSQVGRSRLWKLTFNDLLNPSLGGTINLLLDGTPADGDYQMFDNLEVDQDGNLILLEDVGNNQHNGKIWFYNPALDLLTKIAGHDVTRFGDIGVVGSLTQDEESSGVIDVTNLLGRKDNNKYSLIVVQNHKTSTDTALVEGGQLLLLSQQPIPEPSMTLGLGILGLTALGLKLRRK